MRYELFEECNYFIREDKETSILFLRNSKNQFLLNKSGLYIFRTLLKHNDTEMALAEVQEHFGGEEVNSIKTDLYAIINLMCIYKIVKLEEAKASKCVAGIAAVAEDDYKLVGEFIEKNRCAKFMIGGCKGYYVPENIRAHVMNSSEYYYYKRDGEGNIEGIIVVMPNVNGLSVVNVTAIVWKKELDQEKGIEIAKELITYAKSSMVNNVNKMRISFYAKDLNKIPFLDTIQKMNFMKEAELLREKGEESLFLLILE